MAETPKTRDLETFLAGLPAEEASEVRVAAARIEALEREIGPPGWIERNVIVLGLVTLVLFVVGLGGLVGLLGGVRGVIGLGGVVLLVSAFPLVMLAYLWSVRGQTRLDAEKMALNETHFRPHGGIYFGAKPGATGKVLLVERQQVHEPNLRERTQAAYDKATKRRRWW